MEGKNNNIITTVLVVVLIAAAFYIGKLTTQVNQLAGGPGGPDSYLDEDVAPTAEELAEITDADHIRGNREAKLALVEYSDIECPFCQTFHPTAKKALEEYSEDLMWVYRHFPLDQIHPDARPAAIASECVAKLGGNDSFWSYLDTLYDSANLSEGALIEEATKLGVEEGAFTACLEDSATEDLVDEDLNSGIKAGVNGTPGNIILNLETGEIQVLPGAVPLAEVKSVIDSMLE